MGRITTTVGAFFFVAALFCAPAAGAKTPGDKQEKSSHRWVEENSLLYGYGGLSYGVNIGLNLHGRLMFGLEVGIVPPSLAHLRVAGSGLRVRLMNRS